jgi:hypothetical protein
MSPMQNVPSSATQATAFPTATPGQVSGSQTSFVSFGNPNSMGTWLGSARSSRVAIEGMLASRDYDVQSSMERPTRDYNMRSSIERPTTPLFAADLSMDASESDWTSHVASSQVLQDLPVRLLPDLGEPVTK